MVAGYRLIVVDGGGVCENWRDGLKVREKRGSQQLSAIMYRLMDGLNKRPRPLSELHVRRAEPRG